jgi:hypothetical protein
MSNTLGTGVLHGGVAGDGGSLSFGGGKALQRSRIYAKHPPVLLCAPTAGRFLFRNHLIPVDKPRNRI